MNDKICSDLYNFKRLLPRIPLLGSHISDCDDLGEVRICRAFSAHGLCSNRHHEFAALAVGVTPRDYVTLACCQSLAQGGT